ncbi:MAG: hypothetical protein KDJ24_16430 [Gammaproteobacteria bacterium]|nr:hypothetical protein [Gammaproteobacteria bacterium]
MRCRFVIPLATVLATFFNPVSAESVHRCTGTHGEPVFSQQPCDAHTATRIDIASPSVVGSALRPGERAMLDERRPQHRRAIQSDTEPRRVRDVRKREQQAFRCREKQRALDAVSEQLRSGYKPGRDAKLHRRRASYRDYLASFCS